MRIGIWGHFARNTDMCDGQTVKTRNLEKVLLKKGEEVITVDSYQWKKHPFSFLLKAIRLVRKSKVIVMLPDANGIKVYPYVVNAFAKKNAMKIYSVVGAWLPSFLRNSKRTVKQLKKFDYLLVETKTMETQLSELGFENVVIVSNFKDIEPVKEKELKTNHEKPFKFCVFSRVMKQKGITDAILACDRVNKEFGGKICTLDVYGPLEEDYKEEFEMLCEEYSMVVDYKGIVRPEESVGVLKNYFMLLFPTLFYTEGIPGTIIDAFSAGVPVIASEWESCFDVVSKKDSITYKFGDAEELYQKIKYCVENVEEINDYRRECLKSVEKFSLQTASNIIWGLIYDKVKK